MTHPPRWVVGVVINCLGSITINLGTNLMKLSHKRHGRSSKRPTVDVEALDQLIPKNGANGTSPVKPGQTGRFRGTKRTAVELSKWGGTASAGVGHRSRSLGSSGGADYDDGAEHGANGTAAGNGINGAGAASTGAWRPYGGAGGDASHAAAVGLTDLNGAAAVGAELELTDMGLTRVKARTHLSSKDIFTTTDSDLNEECPVCHSLCCCCCRPSAAQTSARLWYAGAGTLTLGSLLNFASMGFAPQSLLASLGSVQFISNVIFGKVILKEVVTKRILLGTATIITGNCIAVFHSPQQDSNYDQADLVHFYDADYRTLLVVEGLMAVLMHMAHSHYKRRREQGHALPGTDTVMPVAYSICSAIIGTQSVIQAKCLSELITMTVRGDNQLGHAFTYVVTLLWATTTVFWLVRMNRALAMFHGLFIIPALQVFWTFFSVVGGGVYFEEFDKFSRREVTAFSLGVAVVFCGVYFMAPRSIAPQHANGHRHHHHHHHHHLLQQDEGLHAGDGQYALGSRRQSRTFSSSSDKCLNGIKLKAGSSGHEATDKARALHGQAHPQQEEGHGIQVAHNAAALGHQEHPLLSRSSHAASMRTCGVLDHSPMPGGTAEGPQPHVSRAMSWPADGPISPTQPALDLVQRWGLGNMAATRSDDEQEEEEEEEEEEEVDWEHTHTRMMSLGFFPIVTTAEDIPSFGPLLKPFRLERLGSWCDATDIIPESAMSGALRGKTSSSCRSAASSDVGEDGQVYSPVRLQPHTSGTNTSATEILPLRPARALPYTGALQAEESSHQAADDVDLEQQSTDDLHRRLRPSATRPAQR